MTKWFLVFFSFTVSAWEDVTPSFRIVGNSVNYNSSIDKYGELYRVVSHTNNDCIYEQTSSCRKGMISYNRNKYDESKVRKHSFDFELIDYGTFPEFVIIYQDWVRIHADDANGNRPITTIKVRESSGKLYLQHWNNAWQWNHTPTDYDTHLMIGRETMNGEIEIAKGQMYHIELVTQDFSGTGRTTLSVDGIKVSDAVYRASHLTESHAVMTGFYWAKGFNIEHDPNHALTANFSNIKHKVLRF